MPPLGICRTGARWGVASDRVYSGPMSPWERVSSYLAFPSLPQSGGFFLLHFPGGYPRPTLSAILSCEARTFLTVIPFGNIPRDRPAKLYCYYTGFGRICQAFGENLGKRRCAAPLPAGSGTNQSGRATVSRCVPDRRGRAGADGTSGPVPAASGFRRTVSAGWRLLFLPCG